MKEHIYKIGEIINNLEILELIRINNNKGYSSKWYIVKCINDGYTFKIREGDLKRGNSCPCCSIPCKIVIKGINDIATTHQHLIKYFINIEDAYTYSKGSMKKVSVKCPICGFEKKMPVYSLVHYNGITCNMCGDGFSFPNKFVFNVLSNSEYEIISEKKFNWSKGKIYDIYIPKLKCIVENNGIQHYEESNRGRSLKDELYNDEFKRELALKNGIEHYIELDCRKSDYIFIKNSILKSGLFELLNLKSENIDWSECSRISEKNIFKTVYDLWNDGKSVSDIAEKTKLNRTTIKNYLKRASYNNLCDYNKNESFSRGNKNKNEKRVICNGIIYESVEKCAKFYNVKPTTMYRWLNVGIPKHFKYKDLRYI